MKRKSLKLMGLMLAAVLCFGGCGNEVASVDGSSESISSESTVESSTESAASSESDPYSGHGLCGPVRCLS